MKSDTERKKRYHAKRHVKKNFLHIHLSKDLKGKLTIKSRSILPHAGDEVKILRGSSKGKSGRIARVNYNSVKIYIEGFSTRTARGREVLVPFEPSNLLLLSLESTKERKNIMKEGAAVKKTPEKKDVPKQAEKAGEAAPAPKTEEKKDMKPPTAKRPLAERVAPKSETPNSKTETKERKKPEAPKPDEPHIPSI